MKNSRGRRLLGWMLCTGLALAMMLVLLPAQESKADAPECGVCHHKCKPDKVPNADRHTWHCCNTSCDNFSFAVGVEDCYGGSATCTEKARCEVCHMEYGEKDPDNHTGTLTDVGRIEPTCTTPGREAGKQWSCCGAFSEGGEEIPVDEKAHEWGEWVPDDDGLHHMRICIRPGCNATETELHTGGTAYCDAKAVCSVCKKEYGEMDLDNHNGRFHPATCVETAYCEVEDRVFDENKTNPDNHPADKVQPATCVAQGYCDACKQTLPIDPGNHVGDLTDAEEIKPTCTEPGRKAGKICSACGGYAEGGETIEALGHDYQHHDAKAPACEAVGWDAYDTCSRCTYSTYVEKAALGHSLNGVAREEPTCAKPGKEAYWICSVCGKMFSDPDGENEICEPAIIDPIEHVEIVDMAEPATCAHAGKTEGSHCFVCGTVIKAQETIPPKPHTPGPAVKQNEKPAEMGVPGSYDLVRYCIVCLKEVSRETVTINPLPGPDPKPSPVNTLIIRIKDVDRRAELTFRNNGTFQLKAAGVSEKGQITKENGKLALKSSTGSTVTITQESPYWKLLYEVDGMIFEFQLSERDMKKLLAAVR